MAISTGKNQKTRGANAAKAVFRCDNCLLLALEVCGPRSALALLQPVRDLLLSAKHLFVAAMLGQKGRLGLGEGSKASENAFGGKAFFSRKWPSPGRGGGRILHFVAPFWFYRSTGFRIHSTGLNHPFALRAPGALPESSLLGHLRPFSDDQGPR